MKYTTTILLLGMLLWPCASTAQDNEFPPLDTGETVWFEGVLVHAEYDNSTGRIIWLYEHNGTLHDFYTVRPSAYCGEYKVPDGFPKPGERFRVIMESAQGCGNRRIERLSTPTTSEVLDTLGTPETLKAFGGFYFTLTTQPKTDIF
jgi:hypothetical protein